MDELVRILEQDEPIEPSSGLMDAVMRAVRDEATAPPPLRFPWLRMALGMGASVVLVAVGLAVAIREGVGGPPQLPDGSTPLDASLLLAVGLPLATLVLTHVATRFCLRWTR